MIPLQTIPDYTDVFTGIGVFVLIGVAILYLLYRRRSKPALRIFGSAFFTFGIVNPAGQLNWVNRTTSDFKLVGKIILWRYKDQMYKLQEDSIFWINKIPHSLYKFGNPIPLNVLGIKDAEIAVYDEDSKTMVTVKLPAQELKGAIESKVVNELNKVGFNKIEMIVIIVMVISIILQVINVIEVYEVNSSYNSLINQLNQILTHLQPVTTSTA